MNSKSPGKIPLLAILSLPFLIQSILAGGLLFYTLERFSAAQSLTLWVWGVLLLAVNVAGLGVYFFLDRRVQRLNQAAQGIANDKITPKIEDEPIQELSQLSTSLHQVSSRLQAFCDRELTLRDREENFIQFFRASPDAFMLINLANGQIQEVNQGFCQMTGYETQDAIDKTLEEIRFWANGEDFASITHQLKEMGGIYNQECEFCTHLGENRTGLLSAEIVKLQSQESMLLLVKDLTELKQAERALQKAEAQYHSIFENSVEGIFQSTPQGRYITVNPALAKIYGYDSPEDLITSITDISKQIYVQPKRRAEFIAYMQMFDVVSDFESQVFCKDGSVIWISENVRAVKDESDKLLYFEGTVQDITERRQVEEELRQQRLRAERLLLNILPQTIAERLKRGQLTIASRFDQVTVMFADLVDFTGLASRVSATELVKLLGQIFSEFDTLVEQHHLEKIKTIGDAYMVVGGLPLPRPDHAALIAEMALDMQQAISYIRSDTGEPFQLRIGINSGSIVAGVIGTKKFSYDLWGDTVNVASRMESQGLPGNIQVTQASYELLKHHYVFEKRGKVFVKGKGEMTTYWLVGRKRELGVKS